MINSNDNCNWGFFVDLEKNAPIVETYAVVVYEKKYAYLEKDKNKNKEKDKDKDGTKKLEERKFHFYATIGTILTGITFIILTAFTKI
jgi:hypothetical protein